MNTAEERPASDRDLQVRLAELEAVIEALRDHQVDAIIGESDVALVHLRQMEDALRESGERYRAFVANSSEGIWRYEIDPPMPLALSEDEQVDYLFGHGYLAECNDATAGSFGYERAADIVGLPGLSGREQPEQRAAMREFIRSGYRVVRLEIRVADRFGHERWLAMSFLGMPRDGVLARVWGVQRDITEARQVEEDLRQRTEELTALLSITRDLAGTLDLQALLRTLLSRLHSVIDYTGATMAMLEGEILTAVSYDGPVPAESVVGQKARFPMGSSLVQRLRRRQPVIFDDLPVSQLPDEMRKDFMGIELPRLEIPSRSWLLAPLVVKEQLVGILFLNHAEPGQFSAGQAELAQAFADHAAVAIENARLYGEARQLAALNERQRLAGELHDSVSQSLYGISLGAHTVLSCMGTQPERAADVLRHILSMAEAAFSDMRSLIFELRPEALQHHGLVTALNRQADLLRHRHEIRVQLALGSEPKVSAERKEVLYRIGQESLNNIAKHAYATEVWVKLWEVDGRLQLEVRDNGGGFDPALDYSGHLGLRVMRERAERAGGGCEITSAAGQGSTVRAYVPLD